LTFIPSAQRYLTIYKALLQTLQDGKVILFVAAKSY